MPDVMNPVAIENRIRQLADAIAEGVQHCDQAYRKFLVADQAFDIAEAQAYFRATGTETARKMRVRIDTETERTTRDVADAAYRYADRNAKALENELRAWQSVGASVRAMYGVAGRGEGA